MPSPPRKCLAQNGESKGAQESRQIQYRQIIKTLQVSAVKQIPYVMRKCQELFTFCRVNSPVQFKLTEEGAALYLNTRFCPRLHESKFQSGYGVGTSGERVELRCRRAH